MSNVFGWYYPAGAETDPNAPYNRVDLEDVYHDEVVERIDKKIAEFDEDYSDFVLGLLPKEVNIQESELEEWYDEQSKEWKDKAEEDFFQKIFDDVLQTIIDEKSEECYPEPNDDY